jgi:hypothetical protein
MVPINPSDPLYIVPNEIQHYTLDIGSVDKDVTQLLPLEFIPAEKFFFEESRDPLYTVSFHMEAASRPMT